MFHPLVRDKAGSRKSHKNLTSVANPKVDKILRGKEGEVIEVTHDWSILMNFGIRVGSDLLVNVK